MDQLLSAWPCRYGTARQESGTGGDNDHTHQSGRRFERAVSRQSASGRKDHSAGQEGAERSEQCRHKYPGNRGQTLDSGNDGAMLHTRP